VYSLSSHQKKFNRDSSKVVYFELSRHYLQSVTKLKNFENFEKKLNGIESRLLDLHFLVKLKSI